jgi:hypothetical protein
MFEHYFQVTVACIWVDVPNNYVLTMLFVLVRLHTHLIVDEYFFFISDGVFVFIITDAVTK